MVAVQVIVIPAIHSLVSILLLGIGLAMLFPGKLTGKERTSPGDLLIAISLGILYNTAQFILVILVLGKTPAYTRPGLAVAKYIMDLVFLAVIILWRRKRYVALVKEVLRPVLRPDNAALLALAALVGVVAILDFPHVHDSGQLIVTNQMLLKGADFFLSNRIALGFSALGFFPAVLFPGIPLGMLASGFKLFLLILTGLTVIYGIEKLSSINRTVAKFLYFFIVISSFYGLYGLVELGKDSSWAVLFSLIFIFSLVGRQPKQGYWETGLYFMCAISLGMIAIPYLGVFAVIFLAMLLLPQKITGHRFLFPGVVALVLLGCSLLMPTRLAIDAAPHLQPIMGKHVYWAPTDGKTSFNSYFFAHQRQGYKNSSPLIIAGLLGVLLLPLSKDRFADPALRSAGLFPLAASLGGLVLAFMARGFYPVSRVDKIPFTPFSTFDAWNLVKDVPQWYVQIIFGIFFILLLETVVKKITPHPRTGKVLYLGLAVIAVAVSLVANTPRWLDLGKPAHFTSHCGNKNKHFALVLENIYRNPGLDRVRLVRGISSLDYSSFPWDIKHYVTEKNVGMVFPADPGKFASLRSELPFLLISPKSTLKAISTVLKKSGPLYIYELEYFNDSAEGIYVLSGLEGHFPGTCFSSSAE